jgi:hypothetical protein
MDLNLPSRSNFFRACLHRPVRSRMLNKFMSVVSLARSIRGCQDQGYCTDLSAATAFKHTSSTSYPSNRTSVAVVTSSIGNITSFEDLRRSQALNIGLVTGAATLTCISVGFATLLVHCRRRRRRAHILCHNISHGTANASKALLVDSSDVGLLMPLMMLMALISGMFMAIGHHLFYKGLDGRVVPSQGWKAYGIELTSQQLNIAGGTALAFLVKLCLVVAVSTSYTQAIWSAAKACTKERGMSIRQLDAAFSVLGNIVALTQVRLWARHPMLISLATVAWYVSPLDQDRLRRTTKPYIN